MKERDREYFKNKIVTQLLANRESLKKQFSPYKEIGSFVMDDLLPAEDTLAIYNAFPKSEDMKVKKVYVSISLSMRN